MLNVSILIRNAVALLKNPEARRVSCVLIVFPLFALLIANHNFDPDPNTIQDNVAQSVGIVLGSVATLFGFGRLAIFAEELGRRRAEGK